MKVLVCGGRTYDDRKTMGRVLTGLHDKRPFSLVISGGAAGADRLGEIWAQHRKVAVCVFPANWRFEGRAAGPIRNARMLEFGKPDLVVAFPGGPGTQNMIAQAKAIGVEVMEAA